MAQRRVPSIVSSSFTLCITNVGQVFSFGNAEYGAQGHIDRNPNIISSLENITFVAVGMSHSICIDYNGNAFALGRNFTKNGKNLSSRMMVFVLAAFDQRAPCATPLVLRAPMQQCWCQCKTIKPIRILSYPNSTCS